MSANLIGIQNANPQVLVSQQLANSETTLYTCQSAQTVMLAGAAIANTTGSPATIKLSLVKSGGSAGSSNRILVATINANDSTPVPELADQFLGPGDYISAIAGTATAISIGISGIIFQ